jgi:hypothetical protein
MNARPSSSLFVVMGADFFIYPDQSPKDATWCFADDKHAGEVRLCQKAGTAPRTTEYWTEVYLPKQGEFRKNQ